MSERMELPEWEEAWRELSRQWANNATYEQKLYLVRVARDLASERKRAIKGNISEDVQAILEAIHCFIMEPKVRQDLVANTWPSYFPFRFDAFLCKHPEPPEPNTKRFHLICDHGQHYKFTVSPSPVATSYGIWEVENGVIKTFDGNLYYFPMRDFHEALTHADELGRKLTPTKLEDYE